MAVLVGIPGGLLGRLARRGERDEVAIGAGRAGGGEVLSR